jgi:putative aminopeptidase FrvX
VAAPAALQKLLTAPGPSGRETAPAQVWREWCGSFADEVRGDKVGSSMARVPGTGGGPTLAIIGHIDEIGVHVTHIDDDGFLRFGEVGGWDPLVLIGQRVRITTREGTIVGVIGRKPIHLLKGPDREKNPQIKDLHIDIGAQDGDEARAHVRIGDAGVIDGEPISMLGDRVASRSMDNRIGCYVAGEAARLVAKAGGAPGDVIALAVSQEEVTFAGARTSAFSLEPDLAIVVDVTHATDQPGVDLGPITRHGLGSGAVVARGTVLHPRVTDLLADVAEAEELPFTLESLGRNTGTDADAVHLSRSGIPTGLVSVPLRYMHSPVEMVSVADIEVACRLIAAFAQRLESGMSFER